MKILLILLSSLILLAGCQSSEKTTSGINGSTKNGRNGRHLPAVYPENPVDREITRKIRQTLLEDNALSTNAKNIKIITMNGVVTLRGTVKSDREKSEIGKKAKMSSNVRSVDNQIEIIRSEGLIRASDNAARELFH